MGEPGERELSSPERERTEGTETSKYPEEEKSKRDFPSSGERTGNSPNHRNMGLWPYQ